MRLVQKLGLVALAALTTAPPAAAGSHPEPRVIVTAGEVRGPHDRAEIERSARFAWGKIVSCYKALARGRKGSVSVELTVSAAGRVTSARTTGSTFKNPELSRCLLDTLRSREMPQGAATSKAAIEIQLAPGDPP